MTGGILVELGTKEVLTSKNAVDLRNYINLKYNHLTPERKAAVFTDAVNRIVDSRLPNLGNAHTTRIKQWIFKTAVQRNAFFVNYADIFSATLQVKDSDDGFIKEMAKWLENVVERPIDDGMLRLFATHVYELMDEMPESPLNEIILQADEGLGFWQAVEPTVQDNSVEQSSHSSDSLYASDEADTREVEFPESHHSVSAKECTKSILERCKASLEGFLLKRRITAIRAAAFGIVIVLLLLASVYRFAGTWFNPPAVAMDGSDGMEAVTLKVDDSKATTSGLYLDGIGHVAQMLDMTATAYDLSFESCGKTRDHPQYGITFSGTRATVGRTVAVDPSVIPIGSRLYIRFPEPYAQLDGHYVAEDTGRLIKGNKVDIFMGEDRPGELVVHKKALAFGVREVTVYVLEDGDEEGFETWSIKD